MYKTSLNKKIDTAIIPISKKYIENIPNTINLRLFVVKLSYFIFSPIFKVDIGVELPIPLFPWLSEKWPDKKKTVEGYSTQSVHQERSIYPPWGHFGNCYAAS